MSTRKGLVLDANILIRAVLGRRVRPLLETYEDSTDFYAPDVCIEDARKYIPLACSPVEARIQKWAWPCSNRFGRW